MDYIFRPVDRQKPLWVARENCDTVDRMRFYPAVAGLFRQQAGIEIDFTPLKQGVGLIHACLMKIQTHLSKGLFSILINRLSMYHMDISLF